MLVAVQDAVRSESWRAVSEGDAVLDKGLMGEGVVTYEDGRAGADAKGNDGSVLGS